MAMFWVIVPISRAVASAIFDVDSRVLDLFLLFKYLTVWNVMCARLLIVLLFARSIVRTMFMMLIGH